MPLSGSPIFLQPAEDWGPVWIPSPNDYSTAFATAGQICAAWGGTLADILSPSYQTVLTASLNQSTSVVWIGLEASNNTWQWSDLSPAQSAAALINHSSWCYPQVATIAGVQLPAGYGRGSPAVAAALSLDPVSLSAAVQQSAESAVPMCAALRYDGARCSNGWGWDALPCSSQESYACQLSAQGE